MVAVTQWLYIGIARVSQQCHDATSDDANGNGMASPNTVKHWLHPPKLLFTKRLAVQD